MESYTGSPAQEYQSGGACQIGDSQLSGLEQEIERREKAGRDPGIMPSAAGRGGLYVDEQGT